MNILIVDDDNTNLMVLSSMLTKEGYHVIEAKNGLEAIKAFDKDYIEMVLMDVMMPQMDGYQAATIIKEITSDRFVPIIFLTAITEDKALAKCVESGGDDFLTKPYNRIILRSKIESFKRIQSLYDQVSIQNKELTKLNDQIEMDLDLAKHVYKSLVKHNNISPQIFEMWLSPVSTFNGDVVLIAQTISGGYHVMLGDFTGHGMAASLGTIPVYEIFHGMTNRGYKIADIIVEINNKLIQLLPTGYFCAAGFISINNKGTSIDVFNAGIPPIYISSKNAKDIVKSNHLPLGILPLHEQDVFFDSYTLSERAYVCLYSDGVIESKNDSDQMYGVSRLEEHITNFHDIEVLKEDVTNFVGDSDQEDDISILFVKLPFSGKLKINSNQRSYAWKQSYEFDCFSLQHTDPIMKILDAIILNDLPPQHKDRIYTIVTELFNNSLEHGLLELDSELKSTPEGFSEYYSQRMIRLDKLTEGSIKVTVENKPSDLGGLLYIRVNDTGDGFDYQDVLSGGHRSNIYSGRGIMLVKSLCRTLNYSDMGRYVEAVYEWEFD